MAENMRDLQVTELRAECDRLKSDLLELATDVWLQWGYKSPDGGRCSGGLSTLERVEEILRECGKINEEGLFDWESGKGEERQCR